MSCSKSRSPTFPELAKLDAIGDSDTRRCGVTMSMDQLHWGEVLALAGVMKQFANEQLTRIKGLVVVDVEIELETGMPAEGETFTWRLRLEIRDTSS